MISLNKQPLHDYFENKELSSYLHDKYKYMLYRIHHYINQHIYYSIYHSRFTKSHMENVYLNFKVKSINDNTLAIIHSLNQSTITTLHFSSHLTKNQCFVKVKSTSNTFQDLNQTILIHFPKPLLEPLQQTFYPYETDKIKSCLTHAIDHIGFGHPYSMFKPDQHIVETLAEEYEQILENFSHSIQHK